LIAQFRKRSAISFVVGRVEELLKLIESQASTPGRNVVIGRVWRREFHSKYDLARDVIEDRLAERRPAVERLGQVVAEGGNPT